MTVLYYTHIEKRLTSYEINSLLDFLPHDMKSKIRILRRWEDAYSSIYGKLLLNRILKEFNINLTLEKLKYTKYQRPYFEIDDFDFNISHSGNYVICAASRETKLGVDIEEIRGIIVDDFEPYFHPNEWKQIRSTSNINSMFYQYWTRKEALIKADGRGLTIPLSGIDVSQDCLQILLGNINWSLFDIDIFDQYKCSLACSKPHVDVKISKIEQSAYNF